MAYTQKGTHLAFFTPIITLAQNAAEVLKEVDIGGTSADHGELVCVRPCRVIQCGFALTSELGGGTSVAPIVHFKKRPTPLAATSESTVANVTVPDATAVGKVVYENCTPVSFAVGDSMEISHTVGTGTPTGQGVYYFICEEDNEVPANNTDMVAG